MPQTTTHTSSQIVLNLIEEGAFAKAIGGRFRGSVLEGSRVQLRFELSKRQVERLELFRQGQGGRIDANDFADSMGWAKTAIFSCRRSSGVERR